MGRESFHEYLQIDTQFMGTNLDGDKLCNCRTIAVQRKSVQDSVVFGRRNPPSCRYLPRQPPMCYPTRVSWFGMTQPETNVFVWPPPA